MLLLKNNPDPGKMKKLFFLKVLIGINFVNSLQITTNQFFNFTIKFFTVNNKIKDLISII